MPEPTPVTETPAPTEPVTLDPTATASPETPAPATPATTGTSVSVTPEVSLGFNVWGTEAGGQSAYFGPTVSGGVKFVFEDPSKKVSPYFRARIVGGWSGNEVQNQTPAEPAESAEPTDPFENPLEGENINNIDATKNTFNHVGGELEGGIEHRLSDSSKGTTVGSIGLYGEFGGASGVAKMNSYYDGSQNLGAYFGGGLRLGISRIFTPKKAGAPEGFLGAELSGGVRAVTYSVPGNEGGGNPAVGGVFGGAIVGGLRFGRKGRTPASGTPETVQPGTLTQADLAELQKIGIASWVRYPDGSIMNTPGASSFVMDFLDTQNIKDAKGRTIDKITFTWDPAKSVWVSEVYIKDDDPTTADIVTDSGFAAEHKTIADVVSAITRLIFKLETVGSSEATKTVAGLGTYERPDSGTVYKDQEAYLGFVTSPTEIKATVRVNGVDLPDKITIPANTRTAIIIPAAKLGSANLVIDREFPVSIRNEMQGGAEVAFTYKVQPAAPPAPALSFTGVTGNSSANGKGTAVVSFTGTLPAGVTVGITSTDLLPTSWVKVEGSTLKVTYSVPTDGKSVTLKVFSGTTELRGFQFTVTNIRQSGGASGGGGGASGGA